MRIRPIGFSVIVKPDDVEEATDWGFSLNPNDREKAVITEGTVLAIAEGAWSDKPEGSYPKVGDRVVIAKYAGSDVIIDKETGETAKLLVDEDLKAIIED